VAEIAELLKLNQQTVRNMIDRGELTAVRVGPRRVRVRQSDLDLFLASAEPAKKADLTFLVAISDQETEQPLAPGDAPPEVWVYRVPAPSADKAVRLGIGRWRNEAGPERLARAITVTTAPADQDVDRP
jgi:excisionase family DNA binding protein